MAYDLKSATPDTTLPTSGFLFGADSQSATDPSVYSVQALATTLLGSTSLTGATITTSSPVIDAAQTWNAGAVTFTGLKFNVTDTASASGSLLMDLQTNTGGAPTSRLTLRKDGVLRSTSWGTIGSTAYFSQWSLDEIAFFIGATSYWKFSNSGQLWAASGSQLVWSNTSGNVGGTGDLFLTRRGAANLRLGAADAAGSAISISSVASNQLTLASNHGLSNGAAVQITFTAGGAVPSGTAVNTTYYARSISAAVLELYGTYDQALNTASTTGRVAVTTAGTTAFVNRATPFQTLSVQSFTGTDIPGQPFVITGSQGTGTGAGGSIIFQVAPAGTTGTAQNALVDALTLSAVTGGGRLTLRSNSTTSFLEVQGVGVEGFNINNRVQIGGAADFTFYVASTSSIGWSAGTNVTSGVSDTRLWRDAAYTLALRNANNGQTFRLYGRFTDITNDFERFFINAPTTSGDAVQLGTQKGATTGAARALELQTDGTTRLTISATANTITLPSSSTLNCGDSGVVRLRYINSPNNLITFFDFYNTSGFATFANGATNPRINFGGTTSSFPALKRDSASLIVRLADDSADAGLQCAALTVTGNLTISTKDIVTDTTTGTKIGTGTTQKIGFYNKTPVVQPTAVADATDAATVITQLNALLSRMRDLGLIAT